MIDSIQFKVSGKVADHLREMLLRLDFHLILALIFLLPVSGIAQASPSEPPVEDPLLVMRLNEKKVYVTRKGDTLQRVAYLLFGHRTWWQRLRESNPTLANAKSSAILPEGTRIEYLGPHVGREYVVQPGDWLIRIAEWKYGSYESWKGLYEKNKGSIGRPDLIYPGDKLVFLEDGTVRLADSGRVLVEGTEEVSQETRQKGAGEFLEAAQGVAQDVGRNLSGQWNEVKEDPPLWMRPSFIMGFAVGLFLLGVFLFIFWANRKSEFAVDSPDGSGEREERFAEGFRQKVTEPFRFRRPKEEYRLRKEFLEEEGEVDRRPRYQNLLKRKKNYLKSKQK